MIYAKFHCDTEISCSINKNKIYIYFINLEYLKYLYKKIEIFVIIS